METTAKKYCSGTKFKYVILSLGLILFAAAIIIYPDRYVNCCFAGFAMWAECVLPSLFPFMIISLIFIKTGIAEKAALPLKRPMQKLNLPPNAAVCFVLSVLSGYPAGSKIVSEFYGGGGLNKTDCDKLAPLCSTSGPLFIIGSVGFKMFGDKALGVKLFLAHIIAVVTVGLIYAKFCKKSVDLPAKPHTSSQNVLYDAFYGGIISVAVAGGFIAFFYVAANFLYDFNAFWPLETALSAFLGGEAAKGVCLGLAEATTGCRIIAACGAPCKSALAGFLITFGGASILLQQLGYYVKAGVKPFKFIIIKFLQGILCAAIMLVLG